MTRDHEPNASYYSARYAERKRAAERARDAHAPATSCNRCENIRAPGSIFCTAHADEYATIVASGATADECSEFCQRTYWPRGTT